MQVLQKQFPYYETRKYLVSYTDFKPNATRYGSLSLAFLPKGWDIVFVKVWTRTPFAGTGVTTATLRVHDTASLPASDNSAGQYTSWSGLDAITNTSGVIQYVQPRIITTPAPGQTLIGNMVLPNQIFVTLNLNNPRLINNLTAGSFYIWLGSLFNK